jgi:hypothetical protein
MKVRKLIAHGESSTGTKHSLEIEPISEGWKVTIMGPTGKRHAAVKLSVADGLAVARFLESTPKSWSA